MRIFLFGAIVTLLSGTVAAAQDCSVTPRNVPQGYVIRLRCSQAFFAARLNGRTVRLFRQPAGDWLGLMPIGVTDAAGPNRIDFFTDAETKLSANVKAAFSVAISILATRFPYQDVTLSPAIEALHSSPAEMKTLISFRDSVSDIRYWQDSFLAPVPGCVISPFGVKRLHNGKPTGEIHGGVDLRSAAGRPIRAMAPGIVKFAQPFTVLGGAVGLDHGQGLETMYLHMSRIAASQGEHVNRGQIIGYVGSTGRANGPHLHWVVYVNGMAVNPAQWAPLKSCSRVKRPE